MSPPSMRRPGPRRLQMLLPGRTQEGMTRIYKRKSSGKFDTVEHPAGESGLKAPAPPSQHSLAEGAYVPGTPDTERAALARTAVQTHAGAFENMPENSDEALQPLLDDDALVLKALEDSRDAVGEFPSDFGQIIAETINENHRDAEEARHRSSYRPAPVPGPHPDQRSAYETGDPKHPDYAGTAS